MRKITFLQTNDIHFRGTNPRGRRDNYNEAIYAKVQEIFGIAQEIEAKAILVAGDVVDTAGLSLPIVTELAYLFSQSPCPILAIAGQHDEWGHNPDTLARTPFGMLRRLDYIWDVSVDPFWSLTSHENKWEWGAVITGRHYDYEADDAGDYYEVPGIEEDSHPDIVGNLVRIHLAHGLIVERAPGFDMRCTPLDQVKTTADVLCVGDYHPGIGIRKVGNTTVINPGALGRLAANASDIERPVQITRIDVYENGSVEASLIPLTSARPGHEVLDRSQIEAQAERNERMDTFLALLANTGEQRYLETQEIVNNMAAQEKLPETVKAEALKRIAAAQERLKGRGAA